MPRNLTTDQITALSSPIFRPAIFIQAEFKSETLYAWTGNTNTTWNSHTWLGAGALLSFSTPEDSSTVEAKGISIVFSGINNSYLSEALSDYQLGAPVTIYLALYDGTGTLIDTPFIAWQGRMDQPQVDISGTEFTITFACESRLIDMNTAINRRVCQQDIQSITPGDLGANWIIDLVQRTLFWGYPLTTSNV